PSLQLEQEAQSRPEKIVEVVDAQTGERVRVERGRLAAAQARHQTLLEEALSSLVQHTQLARRPHQVGEFVEQARADAVKRPYPRAVEDLGPKVGSAHPELCGDALTQLVGGTIAEGDGQDLAGWDPVLHEPAEALHGGRGLPGAGPGRNEKRTLGSCVRGSGLLGT